MIAASAPGCLIVRGICTRRPAWEFRYSTLMDVFVPFCRWRGEGGAAMGIRFGGGQFNTLYVAGADGKVYRHVLKTAGFAQGDEPIAVAGEDQWYSRGSGRNCARREAARHQYGAAICCIIWCYAFGREIFVRVEMSEAVRLVIWDLDDTFWRGTLSEGGIRVVPENKEIVIELARRGIISSICSKNDFETVKPLLIEQQIWDYFVMPSISWAAKGPRVRALIDAVGLRPATVLFVDDNPSNLEEVRSFVPNIQLAHAHVISAILTDPLFKGKDDKGLTRLQQYKLMERRHQEMTETADTTAFLRSSAIRVVIDHDVEGNIERAIELINRTNQLNFTKWRLSEDIGASQGAAA
jgi:HAD superfamily phosphatase (TIGR01681 family)